MYYEINKNNQKLPFNYFKAIIVPRPICVISTLNNNGTVNLAPYSFFNAVSEIPPIIMFSSQGYKNTISNIEKNGEFVCNIVNF